MRPRGVPSPWKIATPTYGFEKNQPSRMTEAQTAIKQETAASGESEDEQ